MVSDHRINEGMTDGITVSRRISSHSASSSHCITDQAWPIKVIETLQFKRAEKHIWYSKPHNLQSQPFASRLQLSSSRSGSSGDRCERKTQDVGRGVARQQSSRALLEQY